MTDITEFAADDFDPKAWINAMCKQHSSEEPLEKFIAELEMRLQLTAEEIDASIQETTSQAMRRIPFAVQDIYRLQGEMHGLQDQVKSLSQQVHQDASSAADNIHSIAQLDKTASNMKSACNTLKEATELSGSFIKVETIFTQGDLPKVAEILSSMRKSLSLVADVPEFAAGVQKLNQLEDRLQTMIEGSLSEAFAASEETKARDLCGLLLAVGRYAKIEQLYCNACLAHVFKLWDEHSSDADVISWLPQFFSRLAAYLEQQASYCTKLLPTHNLQLLTTLTSQIFIKVSRGIKDRIAPLTSLSSLTAFQRDVVAFARALSDVIRDVPPSSKSEILDLVYGPLDEKIASYAGYEQAQLQKELTSLAAPPALASEPDAARKAISSSVRQVVTLVHGALDRCLAFSAGTEMRPLVKALDTELATYLTALHTPLRAIKTHRNSSASSAEGGGETDTEDLADVLKLVLLANEITEQLNKMDAQIRVATTGALQRLQAATQPKQSQPDMFVCRMAGQVDRMQRLEDFASSLQDSRFIVLPSANSQVESFVQLATAIVNDVLLLPVKQQLQSLPSLPCWTRVAEVTHTSLPSFSSHPQAYITTIGDYLMTLPQLLEVLVGDGDETEGDGDIGVEWLDRTVTAAAALFVDNIPRIPELSHSGAAQLEADSEYLCNVMLALHVEVPLSLMTVRLFVGMPAESFSESGKASVSEGSADAGTLRSIAGMRKIVMQ